MGNFVTVSLGGLVGAGFVWGRELCVDESELCAELFGRYWYVVGILGLIGLIGSSCLIDSCKRLLVFSDNFIRQTAIFNISSKGFEIMSYSEGKKADEILNITDLKIGDKSLEFVMDLKRLISILSAIDTEEVNFIFNDGITTGNPVKIIGKDEEPFFIESILIRRT